MNAMLSNAQRLQARFDAKMKEESTARELEQQVTRLREKYELIVFEDFLFALDHDTEGHIWMNHHRMIERYRKNLAQVRAANGDKKPVEYRKLHNAFLNFIKQTTRFYRCFIQRLVSHFQVRALEWVITQFHLSVTDADPGVEHDSAIQGLVIRSCHGSLVRLGDLSRYREGAQDPKTKKNWGPATGYYTLANKLLPSDGTPHNQLAVIALLEGSHLSSTYHVYRALSVAEPFPQAGDNLAVGFRKILRADKAKTLGASVFRREEQAVKDLMILFVRYHAKCYSGKEFSEQEALESEMLTQLALDLKDRNLSNGLLSKLVLINIAAQSHAAARTLNPATSHAHASFLRLNVSTFTTLHQVFQPELERHVDERAEDLEENISAVGRRMLPSLRLYSTWLRINHQLLADQLAGSALSVLIKQLWQTYANTLSLLAATFSVDDLPKLDYLLEEDDDTIGFQPFVPVNGHVKVNWRVQEQGGAERVHPNQEMLAQIRFLLEDGRQLCSKENVPVTIGGSTITYHEEGIITSTPSIGMTSRFSNPAATYSEVGNTIPQPRFRPEDSSSDDAFRAESVLAQGGTSIVESAAGSETMTIAMNHMVDSLVGPRDEASSDEDHIVFKKGMTSKRRSAQMASTRERAPPFSSATPTISSADRDTISRDLRPSTATYTARDLANMVQNFSAQHSPSLHTQLRMGEQISTMPTPTRYYHTPDMPDGHHLAEVPSPFFPSPIGPEHTPPSGQQSK